MTPPALFSTTFFFLSLALSVVDEVWSFIITTSPYNIGVHKTLKIQSMMHSNSHFHLFVSTPQEGGRSSVDDVTTTTTTSSQSHSLDAACVGMDEQTQTKTQTQTQGKKQKQKKKMYSFQEARRIARGHGFSSRQEFIDYDCAGAYQLPKDADTVWTYEDGWKDWDDFLGICWTFEEGRKIAQTHLGKTGLISSEEEYLDFFRRKAWDGGEENPVSRLPYRPDLKYKDDWISWADFLGLS